MKPARRSPPQYPLDTTIAYGPDNARATKLVAAVYQRPDQKEADAIDRWLLNEGDIRNDPVSGGGIGSCPCDQAR